MFTIGGGKCVVFSLVKVFIWHQCLFVVLIEDVCRVLFDNDEKRVHDGRWWERWAEGRISWLGFSPGRRGSAVCVYVQVCLCWRVCSCLCSCLSCV